MKRVIILNDTRRAVGHIGCQCVMENIEYLCAKNNLKIVGTFKDVSSASFDGWDAVIINGEGTMHDDASRAQELLAFAYLADKLFKKKSFLINTVWQNNFILNLYLQHFEKIFVREGMSKREIERAGYKCSVVPDLSLYKQKEIKMPKKRFRVIYTDSVIPKMEEYLRKEAKKRKAPYFYMEHNKPLLKLNDILRAEKVVTGRFHGVMLCLKYGVRFSSIESNTHKIKSSLIDAGDVGYKKYVDDAQVSIDNMFKQIHDSI